MLVQKFQDFPFKFRKISIQIRRFTSRCWWNFLGISRHVDRKFVSSSNFQTNCFCTLQKNVTLDVSVKWKTFTSALHRTFTAPGWLRAHILIIHIKVLTHSNCSHLFTLFLARPCILVFQKLYFLVFSSSELQIRCTWDSKTGYSNFLDRKTQT